MVSLKWPVTHTNAMVRHFARRCLAAQTGATVVVRVAMVVPCKAWRGIALVNGASATNTWASLSPGRGVMVWHVAPRASVHVWGLGMLRAAPAAPAMARGSQCELGATQCEMGARVRGGAGEQDKAEPCARA